MEKPSAMFANKSELRRLLIAARLALPASVKAQADVRIAAHLSHWLATNQVSVLGVYLPMPGEPDLTALYAQLHDSGVALAMPLVLEKNTALRYALWQPGDVMSKDASRTLAQVPRPLAIGIAYASAQVAFDASAHDVALDFIITD